MVALARRFPAVILAALGACAGARTNEVQKARVELAAQRENAVHVRVERDLGLLEVRHLDLQRRLASLQEEQRRQSRVLDQELGLLQALEQDLVAARKRKAEIEPELAALRALEQQLAQKEPLVKQAETQLAALEAKSKETQARLADLQPKLAAMVQAEAATRAALDAMRPPPPEAPKQGK